jgi:hypothetical protein
MPSTKYDVATGPAPTDWLEMEEDARIAAVAEAHRQTRAATGANANAHATIHVMVENRLAMGHRAIVEAYDRFRAAGVDRHNTVHALASVVTRHMLAIVEQQAAFDQETADRDFAALAPANWKRKR